MANKKIKSKKSGVIKPSVNSEIKKPAPVNSEKSIPPEIEKQLNDSKNSKDNLIGLIKNWLPENVKSVTAKFSGSIMLLTLIQNDGNKKTLPPQKLNIAYKFLLTRRIIALTGKKDYEFIQCEIDFQNNKMTGTQYFKENDKQFKISFAL